MKPDRPARRVQFLSDLMLLAVAIVWGSSYGVVKETLAVYPVLGLLALRFGITFVLLSPALRHLRHADAATLRGVLGVGALLLGIFLAETFGVLLTRASNAAFLISLCVVLTPLVEWALLARRPGRVEWAAVAVSLGGAWLLTGDGALAFNAGDALILVAAVLRALNVCVTKRVMRDASMPALSITAVQSGVVAAGSAVVALVFAPAQLRHVPSLGGHGLFWGSVIYLVLACTLFAFFAQNFAIGRSSPTRVSLLMGSEPAFGALFASVWLGEAVSASGCIGGAMIVAATLMATVPWTSAFGNRRRALGAKNA
ncbi:MULTISPECIES: DMT family transporter [unclassified Caballeronia]|uniref:DMT family transporter n=1 Tax=unclassified Caballeronia TaxID=2646786 RepID=UPI002863C981|nr:MULTISPECIES: DMT family transporter [unclassified Caballeronia]MDR5750737.1 DMT family transporter [Caballeronia sp. LZ024]MDR5842230.1 DMT family transporter [Caballeronia sp. LZ031]